MKSVLSQGLTNARNVEDEAYTQSNWKRKGASMVEQGPMRKNERDTSGIYTGVF
jgi:hypothetical protein